MGEKAFPFYTEIETGDNKHIRRTRIYGNGLSIVGQKRIDWIRGRKK